jgi:hypothetical protein
MASPQMNQQNNKTANKSLSNDFALKKDFIDLQIELKRFVDETGLFTLQDMLKDPLVIHNLEDYVNAHKEQENIKKTKKILKKLLKFKKKNINLLPFIQEMLMNDVVEIVENKTSKSHVFKNEFLNFKSSIFTLKPIKSVENEKSINTFKSWMSRLENIKKYQINKPILTRNFTVSSSHSQFLKKIEKGNEKANENVVKSSPLQKMGNEIMSTASFRNGILKNPTGPGPMSSNMVMATRSPHQTIVNNLIKKDLIERLESERLDKLNEKLNQPGDANNQKKGDNNDQADVE